MVLPVEYQPAPVERPDMAVLLFPFGLRLGLICNARADTGRCYWVRSGC